MVRVTNHINIYLFLIFIHLQICKLLLIFVYHLKCLFWEISNLQKNCNIQLWHILHLNLSIVYSLPHMYAHSLPHAGALGLALFASFTTCTYIFISRPFESCRHQDVFISILSVWFFQEWLFSYTTIALFLCRRDLILML